ncbi:unnamed protein product [Protopolystoma xenopodis]|uniref:Major facilitator superfamily (MFS) profile domain-containing protein n=1 Tax=Protopolystoma xenopodis TaxID=117903 RepID=A0A448WPN6_9PLAT|nr:unnamed protein product [Protopolystoma xenopodis]
MLPGQDLPLGDTIPSALDLSSEEGPKDMSALVCLIVFLIGFSFSWGPLPLVVALELFPGAIERGRAGGIIQSATWIVGFTITWSYFYVSEILGGIGQVFLCFAFFSLIGGVLVMCMIPESDIQKQEPGFLE